METSLVSDFDALRQCQDILTDGTAEIEFRRFLQMMINSRLQSQATATEALRLQRELEKLQRKFNECQQERTDFEIKLSHARRLLESESKARRQIEEKLSTVCDYLNTDRNINNEIRDTLASLNVSTRKRRSNRINDDSHCNEINSTGSFLSDLSISFDDFLDVSKPFKKHRPSIIANNVSVVEANQKRRSARKSMDLRNIFSDNINQIDLDSPHNIVATATTTVLIPQGDGPIEAISKIETIPSATDTVSMFTIEAVPGSSSDALSSSTKRGEKSPLERGKSQYQLFNIDEYDNNFENNKENLDSPRSSTSSISKCSIILKEDYAIPSAPPLQEIQEVPDEPKTINAKLMFNLQKRQHDFSNRTVLRSESCAYCSKKFWFGATALKCRSCSVYIHPDCKHQFKVSCMPKNPGSLLCKNGKQGLIADYVPMESPMLPPLIVHCVKAVEERGLSEVGIYRVSGSKNEIKNLKERILRGKALPNLSSVDVHVLCGCIKDFLRGLREPLIPTNLWTTFSNAVQMIEDAAIERELFAAVDQLPQANRDTLAFLILHLQRVAQNKSTQMPIENLAKIFGPTVLGFSNAEPGYGTILNETSIQKDVMESLLKLSGDYWAKFINLEDKDKNSLGYSFFGTPDNRFSNGSTRKERKFFDTPPTRRM